MLENSSVVLENSLFFNRNELYIGFNSSFFLLLTCKWQFAWNMLIKRLFIIIIIIIIIIINTV